MKPERSIATATYSWTGKIAHAGKIRENGIRLSIFRTNHKI